MHDQRKVRPHNIGEKAREQQLEKIRQFTTLYDSLLERRSRRVYEESILPQLAELLTKNAEAYTMFNYRREVLLDLWRKMPEAAACETVAPPEAVKGEEKRQQSVVKTQLDWLSEELKLSSSIIQSDYKVYAAFVHRRWVFMQLRRLAESALGNVGKRSKPAAPAGCQLGECAAAGEFDLPEEVLFWAKALLKEKRQGDALLAMDERNFHAWEFRRWVMYQLGQMEDLFVQSSIQFGPAVVGIKEREFASYMNGSAKSDRPRDLFFTPTEVKELNFTSAAVRRNFSNYSAWHQRGFIMQGALRRLQQRQWREEEADNNLRDGMLSQAWGQLEEDLTLLTTAIYCDPLDQSAWYYAKFLIHASKQLTALPFASTAVPIDITAKLDEVCLDLVGEERRLGEDMETYWPYLHLATSLLTSIKKSNDGNSSDVISDRQSALKLAREVWAALQPQGRHVNGDDDCIKCLQELCAHLTTADPLRAGMYKYFLSEVTTA
ncbi:Protein prenyltransferase alpha subunit repeat, putative [Trypanosoma equiperdum]|nr:Protein prenyltransferase alpha subunit repeat, putative [Trypanosoma equiperdum]